MGTLGMLGWVPSQINMEMSFQHIPFIQQSIRFVQVDRLGSSWIFKFEQLNQTGVNRDVHLYLNDDQILAIPTRILNLTLSPFQQQINHSNQKMVNMLTNQFTTIFNPMIQNTTNFYPQLYGILNRIIQVIMNQPRPQNENTVENN